MWPRAEGRSVCLFVCLQGREDEMGGLMLGSGREVRGGREAGGTRGG